MSLLNTFTLPCLLFTITCLIGTVFRISHRYSKKSSKSIDAHHIRRSQIRNSNGQANTNNLNDVKHLDFRHVEVSKIFIHPIKSCRGTAVTEAVYTVDGLENDRKFAIIDATTHRVVTARERHKMVLIHPRVEADPTRKDGGKLVVSFPPDSDCAPFVVPLCPDKETLKSWDIVDDITLWGQTLDGYICQSLPDSSPVDPHAPSALLSRYLDRAVHLVYKGPRPRPCPPTFEFPTLDATAVYQDGYPLLVASEESLEAVQDRVRAFATDNNRTESDGEKRLKNLGVDEKWKEEEVVMERFRPNIVVRGCGMPWAEDMWETVEIGEISSPPITLVSKCARCLLPNLDTETGTRDKAVPYKVLMTFRTGKDPARMSKACFGCNGVPHGNGSVKLGDPVRVVKLAVNT